MRVGKIGAFEMRSMERRALKLRAVELYVVQVRFAEGRSLKLGTNEGRSVRLRTLLLAATPGRLSTIELRIAQIGVVEAGSCQSCRCEVRTSQIGPDQDG